MYTYRMVGAAQDNNREYKSDYGTYSRKTGFNINKEWKDRVLKNPADIDVLVNFLFDKDCWTIVPKPEAKKMTKSDIEKALGYEVDIVDSKPKTDKKVISKKGKLSDEQYQDLKNDIKDAFGDIFEFWI